VGLHNCFAEAKTEAEASGFLGAGTIDPVKWFEYEREIPLRDSNAFLPNFHCI
jgi:hypothetical protein